MRSITLLVFLLLAASLVLAQDARYCGPPARDEDGTILRSRALLKTFQALYPCPANGRSSGACPGWYKDHIVPLVCGGCDSVENLQWLPAELKTCRGTLCKDRWERRVYCRAVQPFPPALSTEPRNPQ